MNRARKCLIVLAAAAAAFAPVPSIAAIECKQALAQGGLALTQNEAIVSWRTFVSNTFGASWSNFDLATTKLFSETNLGVAVMHQVSAIPCREVINRLPVVRVPPMVLAP